MTAALPKIQQPARLSPVAKLALVLEMLSIYARARWLLWRGDLPSTVEALRAPRNRGAVPGSPGRWRAALRLARAVCRTLPLLPTESRCLMRSLVLLGLLSRRGIDAVLVIGVKQGPDFAAHAWVESEGQLLLASQERIFSRVATL